MKTKVLHLLALMTFTLFIIGCDNDETEVIETEQQEQEREETVEPEEETTEDPSVILAQERQAVLSSLTNNDQKVWKISEAVLTNDSGTFDISNNFNVTDDELIFTNEVFVSSKTDFNGPLE